MTRSYLLGIDIGTTATKIILVDLNGTVSASVSLPANLSSPFPGWAEEDPVEWWQNVCRGIPLCLQQADAAACDVLAVGVSGMVPTVILVGADGEPLRPSIQQNDARAVQEIKHFKETLDEHDVFLRTGSGISQQSIGPKLLWLSRVEPQVFGKTRYVMGSYDYINFCLTGVPGLEQNWALESGLFDIRQEDWADDLLAVSGIQRSQLSQVFAPEHVVGYVTSQAAAATGLLEGTPVAAGSADHVASAFSSGIRGNGDLLIKLGGAGDILYSLDWLVIEQRLFLDFHVIPGLYLLNGCMASSGSIIKWFRSAFAPEMTYADLDQSAAGIQPGSDGLLLLPYFLGEKTPIFDPLARGIFFGAGLHHTRAHFYRAILEGISFGFNHHLEIFAELGLPVHRVRVANGGAHSLLWRQITADVTGLELEETADHPGSSLGAAFIAGMATGTFSSWDDIDNYIRLKSTTTPDMEKHAKYSERYTLYRQLYRDNRANFRVLAEIEGVLEGH